MVACLRVLGHTHTRHSAATHEKVFQCRFVEASLQVTDEDDSAWGNTLLVLETAVVSTLARSFLEGVADPFGSAHVPSVASVLAVIPSTTAATAAVGVVTTIVVAIVVGIVGIIVTAAPAAAPCTFVNMVEPARLATVARASV